MRNFGWTNTIGLVSNSQIMIKLQVLVLSVILVTIWGQPHSYRVPATPRRFAAPRDQRSASIGGPPIQSGNCRTTVQANGSFKVTCDPRAAPSVRSEHILWLSGPAGHQQILDIEIPNYKINELIKAGFKTSPVSNTRINVLLRKPEQFVDSQIQTINSLSGAPQVNLQYEPVQSTLVHFPVDKPYSQLQGPLVPPPPRYSASNFDIV